ncbi:MAG TPA: serine protease [Fontimonas sp.]
MRLRRWLSAVLLSICTAPAAHAAFQPDLSALDELPLHAAPAEVLAKSIARDRQHKGGGPQRFAAIAPLPLSLADGVWDEPAAGTSRWRLRVYSAGAKALMMEFGQLVLPATAQLRIYDVAGKTVQGPYRAENLPASGRLWTAMVPGEMAVIELLLPSAQRAGAALGLARVAHAWRDPRDVQDIGASSACEINVACPLGNAWRNQIRSVVKLQIPVGDSVGSCTGTLVNNFAEDAKPYVLTAHHCEIRAANAGDVVVYWNFQNSSCEGAADASDTQNISGTSVIALSQAHDMALLRVSSKPPAAYNAFYAGFDASNSAVSDGVGIHHPAGDVKKISEFTAEPEQGPANVDGGYEDVPAWIVTWSQGVTEPGSSGSALWNQDKLVVGVLSGGASDCADTTLTDSYARIDQQWLGGGTAGSQLKAWLDPANSGNRRLLGKNASALGATPTPAPTATPTAAPTATPVPTIAPTATPEPTETPDPDDEGGGGGASSPLALTLLGLVALLRRRRPIH